MLGCQSARVHSQWEWQENGKPMSCVWCLEGVPFWSWTAAFEFLMMMIWYGHRLKVAVWGSIHEPGGPWTKHLRWTAGKSLCLNWGSLSSSSGSSGVTPTLSGCYVGTLGICSWHFWVTSGVLKAMLMQPRRSETWAWIRGRVSILGGRRGRQPSHRTGQSSAQTLAWCSDLCSSLMMIITMIAMPCSLSLAFFLDKIVFLKLWPFPISLHSPATTAYSRSPPNI